MKSFPICSEIYENFFSFVRSFFCCNNRFKTKTKKTNFSQFKMTAAYKEKKKNLATNGRSTYVFVCVCYTGHLLIYYVNLEHTADILIEWQKRKVDFIDIPEKYRYIFIFIYIRFV